ncbi:serine/threonine-protein kinase TBK1 [Onthophagus taurus]|uniref:serine/threonine-protein kinase TBK1 n=1 Tax=Onthophagus taurus TaxID=166361 RepID=UPI0039BDDF55
MSFLRASANYVWCTTSVLGKGATGAVYQGVNKKNGELVAVKTFNQLSHMRPLEVQMREFEVLKKVKHENIVKLLAIEEEQQEGRGKVIVMELCTGGSLFNILDDPENTYGLEEKEFLLVLSHLTAGMKHLRDNNLVHRDLKPGNIMKFICDDGTTVYKLTDFGAARELHEGQQFASLYGTEEYLHPDMYERAVLRKPVGKTFGATVDLWSIGVTLYHVATGNLPFRPFGGRRNKETMYHITTTKASGVISGIQMKDNGPIEWNRELPSNCQLTAGLKKIVTPLLAGLLEADQKRVWRFEKFFNEVVNILSCKVLTVFDVNHLSKIKIYIHPEERYEELEGYIFEQTGISGNDQLLLIKDELFIESIEKDSTALGFPSISDDDPLVLFHKENNNILVTPENELPVFPEFPNLISVESDAAQGKIACSISYVCKRRIEKISQNITYMNLATNYFTNYICKELSKLNLKCQHLDDISEISKQSAESFNLSQTLINSQQVNNQTSFPDYSIEFDKLIENFINESNYKVQELYKKIVVENLLKTKWESSSRAIRDPVDTLASARAKTLVERVRDSWQHLVRNRATRSLSYNDEQFHVLERIKLTETNRSLKTLLDVECNPSFTQLGEILEDWYKYAQTMYVQTMILNKDVAIHDNRLHDLCGVMKIEFNEFKSGVEKTFLDRFKNGEKVTMSQEKNKNGPSNHKKLHKSLKEAELLRKQIMELLCQNKELVDQFEIIANNNKKSEDL